MNTEQTSKNTLPTTINKLKKQKKGIIHFHIPTDVTPGS